MNYGDFIIRLGFGLLFVWGGLEKFFEGFLGGAGLEAMAEGLKATGWAFLGDKGTLVLAAVLAALELLAGILVLINKKVFYAYIFLAFVMLVALLTVYVPRGDWMFSMIHLALFTTLLGLGINSYTKEKSLFNQ